MVGKLIVSKGVDLLLAAWPLVHAREPRRPAADGRLRRVRRRRCERLWASLASGDLDQAREIAARGRGLEGGEERPLRILERLPRRSRPPVTQAAAREAAASVAFAGRLEHDEVGRLMPATDALVFPSTFPEAFGMVAAEAAAAGVASGLGRSLGRRGGEPRAGGVAARRRSLSWSRFRSTTAAVRGIADPAQRLAADGLEPARERARRALAETASRALGLGGGGAGGARRLRGAAR